MQSPKQPMMEQLTDHFRAAENHLTQTSPCERWLLFGLICSLHPAVCVEIGTKNGGTALCLAAALDALGSGRLFCVDPEPEIPRDLITRMQHRVTIVRGRSPAVLAEVSRLAAAPFDLVFVDGDHQCQAVIDDFRGLKPFLRPGAHIIAHDVHNHEVTEAVRTISSDPAFVDCGIICRWANQEYLPELWAGLQLFHYRPSARHG